MYLKGILVMLDGGEHQVYYTVDSGYVKGIY